MNWSTWCDSQNSCEICWVVGMLYTSYCIVASGVLVHNCMSLEDNKVCLRRTWQFTPQTLPPGISRSHLPFFAAMAGAKHLSWGRFGEMGLTPQCATAVLTPDRCHCWVCPQ